MFGNITRRSDRILRPSTTSKRKAEVSPVKGAKRCVLGDISNKANFKAGAMTNATKKKLDTKSKVTVAAGKAQIRGKKNITVEEPEVPSSSITSSSATAEEENSLYTTAVELSDTENSTIVEDENIKNQALTEEIKSYLPDGVIDYDKECGDDPFQVGLYATDIFKYYKLRELKFPVKKYLESQQELNKNMRSILVDWLVEVQESFELNHETLYLAVKLVDLFLGKVQIKRDKLQLVGTTAFWIAAKFDERTAPSIDDFCYICDDAYPMGSILKMEVTMLKTLHYDIGIPLSYRFLRRYARCAKLEMETLTLARYILESALMEYDLIDVRDSMIAGAALLLALTINKVDQPWSPTLAHYSGFAFSDLYDLANRLLNTLRNPPSQVKTIKSKYSHSIFFSVAKLPLPDEIKI